MAKKNEVFEITIPASIRPLIEHAAKAQGWRAKINDADGKEIDNPTTPLATILALFVQIVKGNAINSMTAELAEQARIQAGQEMEQHASDWLAAINTSASAPTP